MSHLPEVVDVGLLDVGDVPVPQVVDDPREVDVPRQRPRDVLQKEIMGEMASATTAHAAICRSCPKSCPFILALDDCTIIAKITQQPCNRTLKMTSGTEYFRDRILQVIFSDRLHCCCVILQ